MLKCATLFTYEIDDQDVALAEINSQLSEKIKLQKNSVGIIMCHPEFTQTGVMKHICSNLPFEVAGITTACQAVDGTFGEMLLTIFVMTSDDAYFRVGLSESVFDDVAGPTRAAYEKASLGIEEKPKLALVFPPLILKYPGDIYPNTWSEIIPGCPVFGTIAIDDTVNFDLSETVHNGDSYKEQMPFVLCYGNINPRFSIGTISNDNMMPYSAEITKADGLLISEINNMSAFEYFKSIGLAHSFEDASNFLFMPLFIDFRKRDDYDGIPVMRVLTQFEQDGSAILRGHADENSILNLSKITEEAVLSNSIEKYEEINGYSDINGILSFSCIIRRMTLQSDQLAELEKISERAGDLPFMFGYAGGEICPTSADAKHASNRFHNYSLVNLII